MGSLARAFSLALALALVALAGMEVSHPRNGWSIPAFGRKYNFACTDCHVGASAKLNDFGAAFRDQGYQLPPEHARGSESPSVQPLSAEQAYVRYCETCHGERGKGDGPMGEALPPGAADLTGQRVEAESDEDLLRIIRNGVPGTAMSAFKHRLPEQTLRELVAYIRTLRQ